MSYPPRSSVAQKARTSRAAVAANGNGTARIDLRGSFEFDFNEMGGVTRSMQFESLDNRLRQKKAANDMVSDSEIEYMIREKLRREQFAIESMFKASDPARNGRVHRNGLLKILNTVCGHIRIDQFHRLLDRLGLDEQQTVSFSEFRAAMGRQERRQQRKIDERDGALLKPVGAARAFSLLRREAQAGGFDPRDLLPEACFEPGGLVLKPQLWRALREGLGVPMVASEFEKFWDRIDTQGTGAVSTFQLLGMLGLSAKQFMLDQPAALVRSRTVPTMQTSRRGQLVAGAPEHQAKNEANVNVEVIFNIFRDNIVQQDDTAVVLRKPPTPASSRRGGDADADYAEELRYLRRYEMLRQRRPLFEHFMDNLFYMFDEAYNAVLVTFRHCDAMQDGCVTLTTFQSILQQFGFETRTSDLEQFLQRFSMRSARGALSYTELLDRLNARGPNSLLHRYLLGDRSPVGLDETFAPSSAPLTPYQLELQLLRFFHRDYLQMYFGFLRHDQKRSGIITEAAFFSVLRRLLPDDEISDAQLDEVLSKIARGRSGAVPYRAFLELFHIAPNSWNRDAAVGRVRFSRPPTPLRPQLQSTAGRPSSVSAAAAAAALEELRLSRATQEEARARVQHRGDRSVSETSLLVEDALRNRFHQVDKLFKQMDRRNTGQLSKAQFRSLLGAAGVTLTDSELDTLWSTLDTDEQGGWTYRQMVRYFMTNLHERTQERLRAGNRNGWRSQTADPNVTRLRQWRAANQQRATQPPPPPPGRLSTPQEVFDLRADALIDKCRSVVVQNWDELKRVLRHLDSQGTSCIQRAEFRALVQEFKLPLTPLEIDTLSKKFETRGDGRFNYLDFLKRFVKRNEDKLSTVLSDKKTGTRLRVEEIVERMREKLLFEWKSLLLAFRRFDSQKTGYLSEAELRRVVQSCGYRLSEDDLFMLLTEFDLDMDGRVNYQEFVMQLLDVAESPQ